MRFVIQALAATLLSGCVPYPIYKTLQPAARVTVLDHAKRPMENVEATLIAGTYPYGFEQHRTTEQTLANGTASFDAMREWRTESLMIHGAQEFFWIWCIRKSGYVTYLARYDGPDKVVSSLLVQLEPGQSSPCPTRSVLSRAK